MSAKMKKLRDLRARQRQRRLRTLNRTRHHYVSEGTHNERTTDTSDVNETAIGHAATPASLPDIDCQPYAHDEYEMENVENPIDASFEEADIMDGGNADAPIADCRLVVNEAENINNIEQARRRALKSAFLKARSNHVQVRCLLDTLPYLPFNMNFFAERPKNYSWYTIPCCAKYYSAYRGRRAIALGL